MHFRIPSPRLLCRELRVLATSREALGLPGEAIYAVPPLSLPDPRRPPAMENLAGYEASGLFVERARAVRQDFELDEGNAASVAEVCYRLDGIPLAIELAAARVKALSVSDISKRLDDSFALLTSGGRTRISHHRTLRATMDWSYELLTEEERILFRRLSVFAGGFTLEAAEAAGEGEGIEAAEVLPLLSSLVDKSLVQVSQQAGGSRYRYLATVRQYGWGKLEASGETQAIRRRHAEHYVELAEESEGTPISARSTAKSALPPARKPPASPPSTTSSRPRALDRVPAKVQTAPGTVPHLGERQNTGAAASLKPQTRATVASTVRAF